MAISFVGRKFGGALGSTTVGVTLDLTALVLGSDAAPLEGDLGILMIVTGSAADRELSVVSAGWTKKTPELYSDDGVDTNLAVFWKFMGPTPDTSLETGPSGNGNDGLMACVQFFRGVDPVTPFDVSDVTATGIDTGLVNAPAITPISVGAWVVVAGGSGNTGGTAQTFSATDLDHLSTSSTDDTFDATFGLGFKTLTGAFNPEQWTASFADGPSNSWAAFTMALRPEGTATPGLISIAFVPEFFVLSAYGAPPAEAVLVPELHTLVAHGGTGGGLNAVPRVTQLSVQVLYQTGVGALPRSRAWTFDFDGHSFYVLDLGLEGTWCYDMETQQWSKFETNGYDGAWNARLGVYWSNAKRTVVSDTLNPYLYFIEPTQPLDEEWRQITYIVTGGVEIYNRMSHRQDSFRLTASVGEVADAVYGDEITMSLRFSDDKANTWIVADPVVVLSLTDKSQEVAWLSLGAVSAPGRIFELTNVGGLIKISAADAEIDGLDDGSES